MKSAHYAVFSVQGNDAMENSALHLAWTCHVRVLNLLTACLQRNARYTTSSSRIHTTYVQIGKQRLVNKCMKQDIKGLRKSSHQAVVWPWSPLSLPCCCAFLYPLHCLGSYLSTLPSRCSTRKTQSSQRTIPGLLACSSKKRVREGEER
jgi:hypothetical protein